MDAIRDIHELVKDIYRHIKEKKDTEEWYNDLLKWRSLFILSIHYKEEAAFKELANGFIALDRDLKLSLAHGLIDTLTQILVAYSGEEYKLYQQQCYQLIRDCLYKINDPTLDSRLFAATMSLTKASPVVNMGCVGLWIEYIARKEDAFAILPLTDETIAGLQLFYLALEPFKEALDEHSDEFKKWTQIQQVLISRLASGFIKDNREKCLEALCTLAIDERVKNKKPVNDGLEIIASQPSAQDKIHKMQFDAKQRFIRENVHPSFMLIVWKSLSEQQQAELAEIFKKYGINILVEQRVSAGQYLFGSINKLVVGVMIPKGGVQVHYPTDEMELRAFNSLGLGKQLKKEAQNQQQSENVDPVRLKIAEKVGFAFFGHYVEGLQIGLNKTLVAEAVRLAELYLSDDEKKQSAALQSTDATSSSGSSSVAQPIRLSASTSGSPVKKDDDTAKETQQEDLIKYVVEYVDGNEDHVVNISYAAIDMPSKTAQRLQEILEGTLGARAASLLPEGIKRSRALTKHIIQVRFEESNAAKLLEETLNQVVGKKNVAKLGK